MAELSILIPARNEVFLSRTIDDILENIEGDTEVIAVCDGYWPHPEVVDDKRVKLIHYTVPAGQRQATNDAARLSRAKYIMKADAHCAFAKGFDVELMKNIEYDWTVIPRMYNLHAFNWKCGGCGHTVYQGPTPDICPACKASSMFKDMQWKPRLSRRTDFARFDKNLHFQYWRAYDKRPTAQGDIADTMCHVGACWMMHRDRYWELGGLDEKHGSWGQMGVEISCKTWLSGGRQVVNKNTWFAHMFRTQGGDFGFPYHLPQSDVEIARKYSKDLWIGGKWPMAKHDLSWLLDKFSPVPEWHEEA
jgi:glycosyltransferase involved in cell wall biosynthesis